MYVTKNFCMDHETDRDILEWLEAQPNRSGAIRSAIRNYMGGGGEMTNAEMLAEILTAIRMRPSLPLAEETVEADEPSVAASNLDGLLDRLEEWN